MLSKLLPWDFFAKFPAVIDINKPGIYAFLVEDPFLEKILHERIPKKDCSFALYSGADITRDFIEEHFINLSFFSSADHIHVMNGENILAGHLPFLADAVGDSSERFVILFFTKSNKAFTEFSKMANVQAFILEAPRFWEGAKLWQFCQKIKETALPPEIGHFVLDRFEHNFESFFWAIETIKLHFSEGKIDLDKLKLLMKKERWDFFELIDTFNDDPQKFFAEILKKEDRDYDFLRSLFAFMQGHLVKVLSPLDLKKKAKLSRYDEGILKLSDKSSRIEILAYLRFFSEAEIMAKSNDEMLINKLRLRLINP